MYHCVSLNINN